MRFVSGFKIQLVRPEIYLIIIHVLGTPGAGILYCEKLYLFTFFMGFWAHRGAHVQHGDPPGGHPAHERPRRRRRAPAGAVGGAQQQGRRRGTPSAATNGHSIHYFLATFYQGKDMQSNFSRNVTIK